jgi:Flp pilus assembly protein TadG
MTALQALLLAMIVGLIFWYGAAMLAVRMVNAALAPFGVPLQ